MKGDDCRNRPARIRPEKRSSQRYAVVQKRYPLGMHDVICRNGTNHQEHEHDHAHESHAFKELRRALLCRGSRATTLIFFYRGLRSAPLQIICNPQHLIRSLDAFGIRLECPLRGHDLHHRIDDRDVGFFEHPEA